MTSIQMKCGQSDRIIPKHIRVVDCCKKVFRVKCCATTQTEFHDLKSRKESWCCTKCLAHTLFKLGQ